MNENHDRLMQRQIERLTASGSRPRLLLHCCCAPCSSAVLERLTEAFDITALYYNPNIAPRDEYDRRSEELARLIASLPHAGAIDLRVADYDPEAFLRAARGLEREPEGGRRCEACFRLRLGEAARVAREGGYDCFTTTLTISPLKDAQLLNAIGLELAGTPGPAWLHSDFKKREGYRRSCELSREYGLYRQDYCGCAFSRAERDRRIVTK